MAAAAALLPLLAYALGLTALPSDREAPSPAAFPPAALALLWLDLGGRGEPSLPRLGPYSLPSAAREAADPTLRLARRAARVLLDRSGSGARVASAGAFSLRSATIWLSRHWSAPQALAALADAADCGHALYGLHEAARGYFGRPLAELSEAEIAVLVVAARSRRFDPWCRPSEVEPAVHALLLEAGVDPTATAGPRPLEAPLHACLE